jgi:hypothetical protein
MLPYSSARLSPVWQLGAAPSLSVQALDLPQVYHLFLLPSSCAAFPLAQLPDEIPYLTLLEHGFSLAFLTQASGIQYGAIIQRNKLLCNPAFKFHIPVMKCNYLLIFYQISATAETASM